MRRLSQKENRVGSNPTRGTKRKKQMRKIDIVQVAAFIAAQTPETKIYLGCDSERVKINGAWHADYVLAIVVHQRQQRLQTVW